MFGFSRKNKTRSIIERKATRIKGFLPQKILLLISTVIDILGSIDEKIELLEKEVDSIKVLRESIYKQEFVVDAENNPQNYVKIKLSDIMDYAGGSQPPASQFINESKEGYIRFLQIRDYENDNHITYIPISKKNKLCDEWDILIARYGASLGRICSGKVGAYNVALAKVIPTKPYYREFLRTYVSTREFYTALNNKGERSAQAGFNQGDIDTFVLYFPIDESKVSDYEETAKILYERVLITTKEIEKLNELKMYYLDAFFK